MTVIPFDADEFLANLAPGLPLAGLFDHLPDVYLYVKDAAGRFITMNTALLALRGLGDPTGVQGLTDFDLHPHHLAEQYVLEDRRVIASRQPLPNQVWLVPDVEGELRWYLSSKTPLFGRRSKTDPEAPVVGIAGVMRPFDTTLSAETYPADLHSRRWDDVLSYVLEHHDDRIEVPELAAMMNLSVSQFDRTFKRTFQMTPQQYILRVRLNAAAQALSGTTSPISDIAQQTGFYDQSYLTKQFKNYFGLTPTAYRQRHGHGHAS